MNQIVTNRIIKELENEVCETHGKSANLKGVRGVIVPSGYCCKEFYNYLAKRIQEELDQQLLNLF